VGKDSGPSARCVPGTVMCDSVCCSEDRRTASVIALPPGVECLTVDREYVLITVTIVGGARGGLVWRAPEPPAGFTVQIHSPGRRLESQAL